MTEIKYVYVVFKDSKEYLDYINGRDGAVFVPLVDGAAIRGRVAGEIVKIGDFNSRWNIQDILESIEREQIIWGNPDIEEDTKDISYGTGE